MKKMPKHYQKPKIKENKVKTNFSSYNLFDQNSNLLALSCGPPCDSQCRPPLFCPPLYPDLCCAR